MSHYIRWCYWYAQTLMVSRPVGSSYLLHMEPVTITIQPKVYLTSEVVNMLRHPCLFFTNHPGGGFEPSLTGWLIPHTVRCHFNVVNFHLDPHKRLRSHLVAILDGNRIERQFKFGCRILINIANYVNYIYFVMLTSSLPSQCENCHTLAQDKLLAPQVYCILVMWCMHYI